MQSDTHLARTRRDLRRRDLRTRAGYLLWLAACLAGSLSSSPGLAQFEEAPTAAPTALAPPGQPAEDWAQELFSNDPLAQLTEVSLADLERELQAADARAEILSVHFPRVTGATREQKLRFLSAALDHARLEVRQAAASQLLEIGGLERVVADRLWQLAVPAEGETAERGGDEAALLGLRHLQLTGEKLDARRWAMLRAALLSPDEPTRAAAAERLLRSGTSAVPFLLDALGDAELRRQAADLLGQIAARPAAIMRAELPAGAVTPLTVGKAREAPSPQAAQRGDLLARQYEREEPTVVRVFFGTNRILAQDPSSPWPRLLLLPLLAVGSLVMVVRILGSKRGEPVLWKLRLGLLSRTLLVAAGAVLVFWSAGRWNESLKQLTSSHQGVTFGFKRAAGGVTYYGHCDISIPPSHEVGQVEQPMFGQEDEQEHVVLQSTETCEKEQFFATVRKILAAHHDREECFVFVHGYNISFEEAARRTAQIHYDLQFKGVPIFYSWPSRANVRSYFFDRNEIQFSHQLIKQFLLDVAEKTGAERIHVIAHSMGADAVTQAISEFPEGQRVFDQIILAAADIDADVFKYQVVPRMVSKAQRVTLYCSRNDWALQASYLFNDSWRAGDSSRGLLVSQGLDTVDASSMDTELLGHSYYGNCLPLLRDVRLLFEENRQPQERDLQAIAEVEALPVWTFAEARPRTPPGETSTEGK